MQRGRRTVRGKSTSGSRGQGLKITNGSSKTRYFYPGA